MVEEKESEKNTTKLQLKTSDDIWKKVLNYKISQGLANNNEAIEKLILEGLSPIDESKKILTWSSGAPPEEIIQKIKEFRELVSLVEKRHNAPLMILHDEKSGTFYCECHVFANDFV